MFVPYLQYTGGKGSYYTPQSFIREALANGFGRVVPRPLPLGTLIAFAKWRMYPEYKDSPVRPPLGDAFIFAIGKVTGWHVHPKTESAAVFLKYLRWKLDELGLIVAENPDLQTIVRLCGQYVVTNSTNIDPERSHELYDILMQAIEHWNSQSKKDERVSLRDFKWIIVGHLVWHDENTPIVLKNLPFSRGFVSINLDVEIPDLQTREVQFAEFQQYQKAVVNRKTDA